MLLLFPGRHHLLTDFQYKYIFSVLKTKQYENLEGDFVKINKPIEGIIFAVTSANHSGTKRNPIPFHLRAMMIQEFGKDLGMPVYVYGINDVGEIENFADYTLKNIAHQSDHALDLSPENLLLMCSTNVLNLYKDKVKDVLPVELIDFKDKSYKTKLPWDYVIEIAQLEEGIYSKSVINGIHKSAFDIWTRYQLDEKIKLILNDPIIGDDGDITESRDYNSYVRQMDDIAELKFLETSPFIKKGNIGDIGCAVGSWIKLACKDPRFQESDFYGIEVARQLFDICNQRKHNGEFENPSVFFAMKNAVTDLVFENESMNTIHTSSLTHEIESYGSRNDLLSFIQNRYNELQPGGVWINRDVIGPENGDKEIFMVLDQKDGSNENPLKEIEKSEDLHIYLKGLSTFSRFIRFAADFRKSEKDTIQYTLTTDNSVKLKLSDAAEFILTKDYTDNWYSEMHERFCFWSFTDWKLNLEKVGYRLRPESKSYQNPWIVENRWKGKISFFIDEKLKTPCDLPPTNMLMIAEKI